MDSGGTAEDGVGYGCPQPTSRMSKRVTESSWTVVLAGKLGLLWGRPLQIALQPTVDSVANLELVSGRDEGRIYIPVCERVFLLH